MSLQKLYHANHLSYGAYNVTGRTIAACYERGISTLPLGAGPHLIHVIKAIRG